MNEIDWREVEINHLQKLSGSGYDFSCAGCGYMYKQRHSDGCEHCNSKEFLRTTKVIRRLELSLQ